MNINPWDARAPVQGLGAAAAPPLPSRAGLANPAMPGNASSQGQSAPPLPPRPNYTQSSGQRLSYSNMGQGYNRPYNYGYGAGFNSGSMYGYGRYPSYGYGYPGNGVNASPNRFVQLAEESSLPAFQSIESIVHAFGSVSMMLESTFHAVHSSFQAVLGVAEHFTKMKLQISQVFSAVAAFRFIKYLYAKFLYLFGLATNNPRFGESVWKSVSGEPGMGSLSEQDIKQPVRWPIIMYMGLVFAAPYIIWKLLGSLIPEETGSTRDQPWCKGEGEHFLAKVLYRFDTDKEGELAMQEGQKIRLAPKHLQPRVRGWLLASSEEGIGLVPANYIKILGKTEGRVEPKPDIIKEANLEGEWTS